MPTFPILAISKTANKSVLFQTEHSGTTITWEPEEGDPIALKPDQFYKGFASVFDSTVWDIQGDLQ